MRRLRGAICLLALALLVSGGLHAQDKKDAKIKGVRPANWAKLGLTDEQKQKVYQAQAEHKEKIAELQKQIDDLKAKEKADLEKLLTDEQKKRFKDILAGKAPAEGKKPEEKK